MPGYKKKCNLDTMKSLDDEGLSTCRCRTNRETIFSTRFTFSSKVAEIILVPAMKHPELN